MYNCHQNQSTFLKKYMYRSKWSINPDANLTCILKGKCLGRLIFFLLLQKVIKQTVLAGRKFSVWFHKDLVYL